MRCSVYVALLVAFQLNSSVLGAEEGTEVKTIKNGLALASLGEALSFAKGEDDTLDMHDDMGATGRLMKMVRVQSVRLAEISLASKTTEEMQCFKRTMCVVGATMEYEAFTNNNNNKDSITLAKGVDQFREILELMVDDIKANKANYAPNTPEQTFPNIFQVLGSHGVGKVTSNVDTCENLFPCKMNYEDLEYPTSTRKGRVTCRAISAVCPGISIGCALCGAFSPGTCGDQCIIAGLYCGTSAIACSEEAKAQATTFYKYAQSKMPRSQFH